MLGALFGGATRRPAGLSTLYVGVFARGLAIASRARRGLFAGRKINFGNNVSFSKRRFARVRVAMRRPGTPASRVRRTRASTLS
jgi:hypothetical protein